MAQNMPGQSPPNKVKMLVWQLAHSSLPVRNMTKRDINIDTICLVSRRLDKHRGPLFFKCKYAKLCWRLIIMEDIRAEFVKCRSGVGTLNKILGLESRLCNYLSLSSIL